MKPFGNAMLYATTSAIALTAALGSGCALLDRKSSHDTSQETPQARVAQRLVPRTGDPSWHAVAPSPSATAVRGYRQAVTDSGSRSAPVTVATVPTTDNRTPAPATDAPVAAGNGLPVIESTSTAASVPIPPSPGTNIAIPSQPAGGGIVAGLPKSPTGRTNEPAATGSDPQHASLPGGQAGPGAWPSVSSDRFAEARRLLERGRVQDARAVLERMSSSTPIAALHELGRTFDPYYLGMLPSIDAGSEPRRAAAYYMEAIIYGSPTAGQDLDRLRASQPGLR